MIVVVLVPVVAAGMLFMLVFLRGIARHGGTRSYQVLVLRHNAAKTAHRRPLTCRGIDHDYRQFEIQQLTNRIATFEVLYRWIGRETEKTDPCPN